MEVDVKNLLSSLSVILKSPLSVILKESIKPAVTSPFKNFLPTDNSEPVALKLEAAGLVTKPIDTSVLPATKAAKAALVLSPTDNSEPVLEGLQNHIVFLYQH